MAKLLLLQVLMVLLSSLFERKIVNYECVSIIEPSIHKLLKIEMLFHELTNSSIASLVLGLYQNQSHKWLLADCYCYSRSTQDSISNMIQSLWVLHHAIWANQYNSNFSKFDEWYLSWPSRQVCNYLSWWHLDLFKDFRRTWSQYMRSI